MGVVHLHVLPVPVKLQTPVFIPLSKQHCLQGFGKILLSSTHASNFRQVVLIISRRPLWSSCSRTMPACVSTLLLLGRNLPCNVRMRTNFGIGVICVTKVNTNKSTTRISPLLSRASSSSLSFASFIIAFTSKFKIGVQIFTSIQGS